MSTFSRNNITLSNKNQATVLSLVGLWQNDMAGFIAVLACYSLLIISGIILNSLVIFVMIRSRRHQKSISNLFITHLAAVDLVFRVVAMPPLAYLSIPSINPANRVVCKSATLVLHACGAAMFGSLVVIAVDRYQNIVHPLQTLKRKTKPHLVVVLVWLYSLLASVMLLYTAEQVPLADLPEGKAITFTNGSALCDITPGLIGGVSVTIYVLLTFVVPMVILIFTYTSIFVSLRRRSRSGLVSKAAAKSKAKSARMLVIVVSGFVCCWGPSVVMTTLRTYGVLDDVSVGTLSVVVMVSSALQFCSSLANAVVYAFYNAGFKQDLLALCCPHRHATKHSNRTAPSTSSKTKSSTSSMDTAL